MSEISDIVSTNRPKTGPKIVDTADQIMDMTP